MPEIETWGDLLAALQALTPEQLKHPAQVVKHQFDCDAVHEACPVVSIGTVEELEFEKVRSSADNKHHPEEVILFIDSNRFALDGAIAYEVTQDLAEEDWDPDTWKPIYPANHSPEADWTNK